MSGAPDTNFDFTTPDFGNLIVPPTAVGPSSGSLTSLVGDVSKSITGAVTNFYSAETAINNAKNAATLSKVNNASGITVAKSAPSLLLFSGLALAAVLIFRKPS